MQFCFFLKIVEKKSVKKNHIVPSFISTGEGDGELGARSMVESSDCESDLEVLGELDSEYSGFCCDKSFMWTSRSSHRLEFSSVPKNSSKPIRGFFFVFVSFWLTKFAW